MRNLPPPLNPPLESQKARLFSLSKAHTRVNRLHRLLELNDLRNNKARVLRIIYFNYK